MKITIENYGRTHSTEIKGEDAYDKEKELKIACKNNSYIPLKKYPGYTESFNKQIKTIYEQFKKTNSEVS
jgi:hypothetical protein